MPVVTPAEAVVHELHGSRFTSFVAPSLGSETLCAWRLDIAAGSAGFPHTVTREEVFLCLEGAFAVRLDGVPRTVTAGDVVHVPAGAEVCVSGGGEPAAAWVTTTAGIEAVGGDGTRIVPPWTR